MRSPPPGTPSGRLRVALDATPLLGTRTGVGEFCLQAIRALSARSDLDVGAFAVSWRRRHLLGPELPPGARLLDRPMPARPLHKAWSHGSFPPIEMFIGRNDVVHGTNFVVPPAWAAATVVTVHDLTPVRFPELVNPDSLDFPHLVRAALRRGAWVHTPSQFVADEVVEAFGADPARVRAVHHGLTVPLAPPGRVAAPAGQAVDLLPSWARSYVLALGTVEPRKDFPTLARAFAQVAGDRDGLALVIAGPEGWGSGQLDQALAASPAAARVVRLGWVDRARRNDLIAGATVLAYPSLYEGFGFPPLEAMALGTPVVASRSGALPEVLGNAAYFVPVGDVDALAGALAYLLENEGARRELAVKGLAQAGLYTWAACAEGLAQLYRGAALR